MKPIIKQFIIVILSFGLIMWVQCTDDKKHGVIRLSWWDKLQFPLLVSCLIGLVLNLPFLFHCADNSVDTSNSSDMKDLVSETGNKPFLQELITPSKTEVKPVKKSIEPINPLIAPLSDQTIYTDLPDF